MQRERGTGGFTLIELLVVIAILGVLATAVVLVINPAELLKQGRDSTRLSDLAALNSALGIFQVDQYDEGLGTASTTYISIPDTSPTCADLGLPSLPAGWTYHCAPPATYTKTDGSGWIPVNFSLISSGSPLSKLPIDPVNTTSSGEYYTYTAGGSYELTAIPESEKYRAQYQTTPSLQKFPGVIAEGSDLNLSSLYNAQGLVGYWPLDGNANDMSGNGNDGTLVNGPTWQTGSNCKIGGCLLFPLPGSQVTTAPSVSFNLDNHSLTLAAWFYVPSGMDVNWTGISLGVDYQSGVQLSEGRFFSGSGTVLYVPFQNKIPFNQWYYLVATIDTSVSTGYVYVNGELIGSGTYSTSLPASNHVIYLHAKTDSNTFNDFIDDVRVYNRALSAAEVRALYNAEQ